MKFLEDPSLSRCDPVPRAFPLASPPRTRLRRVAVSPRARTSSPRRGSKIIYPKREKRDNDADDSRALPSASQDQRVLQPRQRRRLRRHRPARGVFMCAGARTRSNATVPTRFRRRFKPRPRPRSAEYSFIRSRVSRSFRPAHRQTRGRGQETLREHRPGRRRDDGRVPLEPILLPRGPAHGSLLAEDAHLPHPDAESRVPGLRL